MWEVYELGEWFNVWRVMHMGSPVCKGYRSSSNSIGSGKSDSKGTSVSFVCSLNLLSAVRYYIYKYIRDISLLLLRFTKSEQEIQIVAKKDCYLKWDVNP